MLGLVSTIEIPTRYAALALVLAPFAAHVETVTLKLAFVVNQWVVKNQRNDELLKIVETEIVKLRSTR